MDLRMLGFPENKNSQLRKKGIDTVEGLLRFCPRKYYDYRTPKRISECKNGENCAVIGVIQSIKENTAKKYTDITLMDTSGQIFGAVFFGSKYAIEGLKPGDRRVFCGKLSFTYVNRKMSMTNPRIFQNMSQVAGIFPEYSKIMGMSDEYLKKMMAKAIDMYTPEEYLEQSIIRKFGLATQTETIMGLHRPSAPEDVERAQKRVLFDQLFELAFRMEEEYASGNMESSVLIRDMNSVKPFIDSLPFKPTDGPGSQLETVRAITRKIRKGKVTTSLVQGDVGCGKTMVAFLMMLMMAENGYQSVLMAPTTILATQHYEDAVKYFKNVPFVKPVLLTAGLKASEKRKALEQIKNGSANVIIGTHSVISDSVTFSNLGLSIVDEEHRFGVIQREKINTKIDKKVHRIMMSATPIPRTLGLSIYGEGTDIYTITQMPSGRKQTKTEICTSHDDFFASIANEVKKGRQAYIVCPLIDESSSEKMSGVASVNQIYEEAIKAFAKDGITVGVINGKMKKAEIEEQLQDFASNKCNVIISTTIVEVGVNNPNATVMAIANAERFGLAQLHQLRGRVGRGNYQGYCILSTEKDDVERLNVMTATTDGFKIAEEDIKLRGMGEFIGTKQTGNVENVMLMIANPGLYNEIKQEVRQIRLVPGRKQRYEVVFAERNDEDN